MKLGRCVVAATAIVCLGSCGKAPAPMTSAERAALADTVGRIATEYVSSMSPRVDVDKMLSYYENRPDLIVAGEGMVWPGYDSLAKLARVEYPAGSSLTGNLDRSWATVLSRDVVVLTATFHSVMKDPAGKETSVQGALTFVFHRTPDGWKIAVESSSATEPAPAPAKPARRR